MLKAMFHLRFVNLTSNTPFGSSRICFALGMYRCQAFILSNISWKCYGCYSMSWPDIDTSQVRSKSLNSLTSQRDSKPLGVLDVRLTKKRVDIQVRSKSQTSLNSLTSQRDSKPLGVLDVRDVQGC